MLRFFGWVDQAETDFLKGRSLAIDAAAHALTAAGFALPEPIYRLRFDEGAPLQLKGMGIAPVSEQAQGKPTPAAPDVGGDTSPDTDVERMVTKERAETGDDDLLDHGRPIE